MNKKNLIIWAWISGLTIANNLAEKWEDVLVIDKRNHLWWNCYDFLNEDGILVPLYWPHFFHTNDEAVWKYVNNFSEWTPYEHKVLSSIDGKTKVPVPVNITTVNKLFGINIKEEKEMSERLEKNVENIDNPKNSEESALARVGKVLYEKLFKNYTKKQRDLRPEELDASVMNRIPVRANFDDRYFNDKYQAMPKYWYTKMFEKMVDNPNITIELNTSFDKYNDKIELFDKIFFTWRIDSYFQNLYWPLEYRSLKFNFETLDQKYFQETAQINYPNTQKYTRITEPKHATWQICDHTTIIKEYSTREWEPYYPVPREKNKKLYDLYKEKAEKLEKKWVYFVWRLAEYKYFNMDQAFKNTLDLVNKLY